MSTLDPHIDIRLSTDEICHLSREHPFSITILIVLRSPHPEITVKQDSVLNAQAILDQGLVEIVDSETGARVDLLSTNNLSSFAQNRHPADDCAPVLKTLTARSTFVVLTTASDNVRDYRLYLDTTSLAPNRTYTVSWKAPHQIDWWLPSTAEAVLAYIAQHKHLPPTAIPPIFYSPVNPVRFFTHSHLVQPPTIMVSLSAPCLTYPLSSQGRFLFTLEFTSQFSQPVSVLANRPLAISTNSDITILDALTSRRTGIDLIDVNVDGPWEEEDFLHLLPHTPYKEERVLDGLDGLESGKEYVLNFVESTWTWWGAEEMQDVLKRDRTKALPFVLPVKLVCNEEIRFRAE